MKLKWKKLLKHELFVLHLQKSFLLDKRKSICSITLTTKNVINNDSNIQICHKNISWTPRKKIYLKGKMTVTKACKRTFYRKVNIKQTTPPVLFIFVTLGEQTSLFDSTKPSCRKNLVLDRLLDEHLRSW